MSKTRFVRHVFASVLLLMLTVAAAWAQSTGATLLGTVTDEQGGVLPGVTVTVTNVDSGAVREVITDQNGRFRATALPPGPYTLRAAIAGFAIHERSGLTLTIGQEATLNVKMAVAGVTEDVTVTGEVALVETTANTVGTTVSRAQLDSLPVPGRNFVSLASLTPGVTSVGSSGGAQAGGQLRRDRTVLIDGVRNDETVVSGERGGFSLEAVREYVVLPSVFSAEVGESSGLVVSVVTRSGTNQLQGRGFLFHRDDSFDSQDYFSKKQGSGKAPISEQRFGGFAGGPIVRDRMHYFVSYESLRTRKASVITSPLVPVAQREVPNPTDGHQLLAKVDRQFGSNHTLTVKYLLDDTGTEGNGIGDFNTRERGTDRTTRNQDVTVALTSVLSNRAVNEVRGQVAKFFRWSYVDKYYDPYGPTIIRPSGNFGKAANQPQGDREWYYQLLDNFTYTRGAHSFKVGGSAFVGRASTYFLSNKDGTFRFLTDAPFDPANLSTYPSQYTRVIGNPLTKAPHEVYAAFAQDTWQVNRKLTLNLGVRYALETTWKRAPLVNVPMDTNDVAPRMGFAWDPVGTGKTVVRGGFGLYYNRTVTDLTQQVTLAAQSEGTVTINNPGYPDPFTRGASLSAIRSTQVPPQRVHTPYTRTLSLGAKRDLGASLAVAVDVIHTRGFNLFNRPDINYPDPVTHLRPNPNFLIISQPATDGQSWSNALLTHVERRTASGMLFSVAYTLSKALRNVEDFGFVAQDQNNRAAEKGPASTDRLHQIVATVTLPLPGGFQIGALIQARSGLPYDITTGKDNNGDLVFNDRPDLAVSGGDPRDRATFFSAFTGRVGNLGRNAGRGPNFWQLDARASKIFRLSGRRRVEGFVEAFNLSNRVNFGTPVGTLTSGSFGTFTGLASGAIPRQVELGLRFDF